MDSTPLPDRGLCMEPAPRLNTPVVSDYGPGAPCVLLAGHEGAHHNGKGMSWRLIRPNDEAGPSS